MRQGFLNTKTWLERIMSRTTSLCAHSCRNLRRDRRGAVLVLFGILIVVIFAMIAFAVDVAYMQLVRAELRAATDAAAKAGALELRLTDGNGAAARTAAIAAAARNTVGGKPLTLNGSEIELGRSVYSGDGTYQFVANQTPYTSLRINSNLTPNSAMGSVRLFFGNMMNTSTFAPQQIAAASQLQQEIVLCLDRSHSMCFDMSGVSWSYPPLVQRLLYPITANPDPNYSRWAALDRSVDTFLSILRSQRTQPRVGLVTWGSDIGRNTVEFLRTGRTEVAVRRDVDITSNYGLIESAMNSWMSNPMLGGTNMAAGLDDAIQVLTAPGVSTMANRIIVLMTDGDWNQGRSPILSANDAAAAGVMIHTIGMLNNDQATLQEIARITGGEYIYAADDEGLEEAFRKIARMLPVALTE
jgi:Ca-activated chloride channel family protein